MKFSSELYSGLEHYLQKKITGIEPVSGGDINQALRIETSDQYFFLKYNQSSDGGEILQAELIGLNTLAATRTIRCPQDVRFFSIDNTSCLLMPFIQTGSGSRNSFEILGKNLSELHRKTSDQFGFSEDNYIGRLHQSNTRHERWPDFFLYERILPQVNLAISSGQIDPSGKTEFEYLSPIFNSIFPEESPSLIHGDLWSGNYLIDQSGKPWIIDPSVYFGHREMDLAMSKLFGGFHPAFYDSYHENFPLSQGFEKRVDLYQLYYLLVHVNLFGKSYLPSVFEILSRYR